MANPRKRKKKPRYKMTRWSVTYVNTGSDKHHGADPAMRLRWAIEGHLVDAVEKNRDPGLVKEDYQHKNINARLAAFAPRKVLAELGKGDGAEPRTEAIRALQTLVADLPNYHRMAVMGGIEMFVQKNGASCFFIRKNEGRQRLERSVFYNGVERAKQAFNQTGITWVAYQSTITKSPGVPSAR